ncbi:hypothetical protein CSA37_01445 [Candidatus Fermentibacteria bacterium]|nr:MAG: hypothetical protein CSA37_01445 [Candidatus Fermentibacteria bacterium]
MESDVRTVFLQFEMDFVTGMGSIGSVYGDYFDISETGPETDARALYNDWCMVGKDILKAIQEVGKTTSSTELD